MQIMLALVEARRMDPGLILDFPLAAVRVWSHDPGLRQTARLASGRRLTAVEHQWGFHRLAAQFVGEGGCEGIVPGAEEILRLWEDVLTRLERRDFEGLAPHLDWVLKWVALQRAMGQNPGLSWESPELKHLDHLYGTLGNGLFWTFSREGLTRKLVTEGQIERLMHEPPANTRAALRVSVLRNADPGEVVNVDWDRVTLRQEDGRRPWPVHTTIHLPDPLQCEPDPSEVECGRDICMTN
jgi:proteasome accessory factor A